MSNELDPDNAAADVAVLEALGSICPVCKKERPYQNPAADINAAVDFPNAFLNPNPCNDCENGTIWDEGRNYVCPRCNGSNCCYKCSITPEEMQKAWWFFGGEAEAEAEAEAQRERQAERDAEAWEAENRSYDLWDDEEEE